MTAEAFAHRRAAEAHLLEGSTDSRPGEHFNLYTREEGDEIY